MPKNGVAIDAYYRFLEIKPAPMLDGSRWGGEFLVTVPAGVFEDVIEETRADRLNKLIERLEERVSTAAWLVAVSSVRPEELAFKWKDLDAGKRMFGSCARSTVASFTPRSITAAIAPSG